MNNAIAPMSLPSDERHQPRTHLFVAATLYADGASTPVRIRNMSPSGALIEAAALPGAGSQLALKRGPLHATGYVAWQADKRAGVRFDATVHVPDWMARNASTGQDRVDAVVNAVKADETAELVENSHNLSVDAELLKIHADLAQMGRLLVEDVILVATHPEIQAIDISLQRIDRIRQLLNTE